MAQFRDPIKTREQTLEAHGKTYAAVARELGLREASV